MKKKNFCLDGLWVTYEFYLTSINLKTNLYLCSKITTFIIISWNNINLFDDSEQRFKIYFNNYNSSLKTYLRIRKSLGNISVLRNSRVKGGTWFITPVHRDKNKEVHLKLELLRRTGLLGLNNKSWRCWPGLSHNGSVKMGESEQSVQFIPTSVHYLLF